MTNAKRKTTKRTTTTTKVARVAKDYSAAKAKAAKIAAENPEEPKLKPQMKDTLSAARVRWGKSNCGDWLADQLEQFKSAGKFDYVAFVEFLLLNDVPTTGKKWFENAQKGVAGFGNHGWQGQLRMNGRLQLEKIVLQKGVLVQFDGTSLGLPEDALDLLAKKHPKVERTTR